MNTFKYLLLGAIIGITSALIGFSYPEDSWAWKFYCYGVNVSLAIILHGFSRVCLKATKEKVYDLKGAFYACAVLRDMSVYQLIDMTFFDPCALGVPDFVILTLLSLRYIYVYNTIKEIVTTQNH